MNPVAIALMPSSTDTPVGADFLIAKKPCTDKSVGATEPAPFANEMRLISECAF